MSRLTCLLAIVVFCCSTVQAQETSPVTTSGATSLMFTFNGFGDFGVRGSYAGSVRENTFGLDTIFADLRLVRPIYGFGMKMYVADKFAIRAALGFNLSNSERPVAGDTTGKTDSETQFALGFMPGFEYHFVNTGPVTAYTGAFFNISSSTKKSGANSSSGEVTRSDGSVGGGVILGAEFFPWKQISFGAEYQLGVYSSSSSTEYAKTDKTSDGPSFTDIGIGSLSVLLNLYF